MCNWNLVVVLLLTAIVPELVQSGKTPSCQDPGVCGKYGNHLSN